MTRCGPSSPYFAGLASFALVAICGLRKTPKQEGEMIRREDEAMPSISDDQREIDRWVP
jgi:hypothetical protein